MISFYRNLALGLIPYGLIGLAQAGGYQMQQRSVSGLGRGLSGESAIADDASVLASNPAGLLWLKPPSIELSSKLSIATVAALEMEQHVSKVE